MKIRTIEEIEGTKRDVSFGQGRSLRLILERDKMGFSFHKTIIRKGEKGHWHYKNHLESCYCIQGSGEITDLKTGQKWEIIPETIYLLDEHDDHTFEADEDEDVILISVFNPPLTGEEIHDSECSYTVEKDKNRKIAETIYFSIENMTNKYDAIQEIKRILDYGN